MTKREMLLLKGNPGKHWYLPGCLFIHMTPCVSVCDPGGAHEGAAELIPPGNPCLAWVQMPEGAVHMCRLGVLWPNITV